MRAVLLSMARYVLRDSRLVRSAASGHAETPRRGERPLSAPAAAAKEEQLARKAKTMCQPERAVQTTPPPRRRAGQPAHPAAALLLGEGDHADRLRLGHAQPGPHPVGRVGRSAPVSGPSAIPTRTASARNHSRAGTGSCVSKRASTSSPAPGGLGRGRCRAPRRHTPPPPAPVIASSARLPGGPGCPGRQRAA